MQFDEFLNIVDLLKNISTYEAKIAELSAREKAIVDATTTLKVTGDVVKAQDKADAAIAKATEMLEQAKVQADVIVSDSRVVFDKRHGELKAREILAEQAIANYTAIKNSLSTREGEFRAVEKQNAALASVLEAQRVDLAAKQVELDERLKKLREVMG